MASSSDENDLKAHLVTRSGAPASRPPDPSFFSIESASDERAATNESIQSITLSERRLIYQYPRLMELMLAVQRIVLVIGMLWVIAVTIGFVMQEFLNIMTFKIGSPEVEQMLFLNMFPSMLTGLALFLHYMEVVTRDAFDRPSFMRTRSLVAAAFYPGLHEICASNPGEDDQRQIIDQWFQKPSADFKVLIKQAKISSDHSYWFRLIVCIQDYWFTYVFTLFAFVGAGVRVGVYWGPFGLEWSIIPTYAWGGAFVGTAMWVCVTIIIFGIAELAMNYGQPKLAEHLRQRLVLVAKMQRILPDHIADLNEGVLQKLCEVAMQGVSAQGKKLRDPLIPHRWLSGWMPASTHRHCHHCCRILILFTLGQSIWYVFVLVGRWLGEGPDPRKPSNRPVLMFGGIFLIPAVILVNSALKEFMPTLHGYEDDPGFAKKRDEDDPSRATETPAPAPAPVPAAPPRKSLRKLTLNACGNIQPKTAFERYGWLFVIEAVILFLGFISTKAKPNPVTSVMFHNVGKAWVNTESSGYPPAYPPAYPVCSMRWSEGQLGVLDMIAFATYSYAADSDNYTAFMENSFSQCSLQRCPVLHIDPYNIATEEGKPRVVATYLPSIVSNFSNSTGNGTVVIAVKGSDQIADIYADVALYATIAILELASFVIPVLDILPNGLIANIITITRSNLTKTTEARMRGHLTDVITNTSRLYPEANIVLTGHSLGGGLAQAIGAQEGLETIVFSSPGAHFSRERFQMDMEQQYRNLVNVVPDGDLVARVERQDSTAQHIVCRNKIGRYMAFSPVECHYLRTTTCELWRACGDFRKRDFTKYCENYTNTAKWGKYMANAKESAYET